MLQDLSESVVVEPYQASSECVEFSVTVLGSSKGPVVLLPTEVESYNMEDDLIEHALDFEIYKARREVAHLPLLLLFVVASLFCQCSSSSPPVLSLLSCCCFVSCLFCLFLVLLLFFLFLPGAGVVSSHFYVVLLSPV